MKLEALCDHLAQTWWTEAEEDALKDAQPQALVRAEMLAWQSAQQYSVWTRLRPHYPEAADRFVSGVANAIRRRVSSDAWPTYEEDLRRSLQTYGTVLSEAKELEPAQFYMRLGRVFTNEYGADNDGSGAFVGAEILGNMLSECNRLISLGWFDPDPLVEDARS